MRKTNIFKTATVVAMMSMLTACGGNDDKMASSPESEKYLETEGKVDNNLPKPDEDNNFKTEPTIDKEEQVQKIEITPEVMEPENVPVDDSANDISNQENTLRDYYENVILKEWTESNNGDYVEFIPEHMTYHFVDSKTGNIICHDIDDYDNDGTMEMVIFYMKNNLSGDEDVIYNGKEYFAKIISLVDGTPTETFDDELTFHVEGDYVINQNRKIYGQELSRLNLKLRVSKQKVDDKALLVLECHNNTDSYWLADETTFIYGIENGKFVEKACYYNRARFSHDFKYRSSFDTQEFINDGGQMKNFYRHGIYNYDATMALIQGEHSDEFYEYEDFLAVCGINTEQCEKIANFYTTVHKDNVNGEALTRFSNYEAGATYVEAIVFE